MQRNPIFSQLLLYVFCFGTNSGRGNGTAFGFQDRCLWITQAGFLLASLSFPSGNPIQVGQDDFGLIHVGFKCNFTSKSCFKHGSFIESMPFKREKHLLDLSLHRPLSVPKKTSLTMLYLCPTFHLPGPNPLSHMSYREGTKFSFCTISIPPTI